MITNQIKKGKRQVEYCPMDETVADYMTKGLQGIKFAKFRSDMMGFR